MQAKTRSSSGKRTASNKPARTAAGRKAAASTKPVASGRAKPAPRKAPVASKQVKPTLAPAPVPADKPGKGKAKGKLVRDSFTMPQADFALIAVMKDRAVAFGRPAKKSELLRAGLKVLAALDNTGLRAALDALTPLKPGRPKKS